MVWPLIIAAGSALGSAFLQKRGQDKAQAAQERASAQALTESRFRPYNVRTTLGGAQFINRDQVDAHTRMWNELGRPATSRNAAGVNGFINPSDGQFYATEESATANADPRLTSATNAALNAASSATDRNSRLLGMDPNQLAQERYSADTQRLQPQRALDIDRMMGTLGASGTRGHMIRDGGFNVQGSQYGSGPGGMNEKPVPGQMRGSSPYGPGGNGSGSAPTFAGSSEYNPLVASAFRGFAEADYGRWNASLSDSMSTLDRLLSQQQNAWAQVSGLNGMETDNLRLGAELGGRNVNPTGSQVLSSQGNANAQYAQQNGRNNANLFNGIVGRDGSNLQGLLSKLSGGGVTGNPGFGLGGAEQSQLGEIPLGLPGPGFL